MSNEHKHDAWIPHTDGRKVWAVNARTGESRPFVSGSTVKILGVHPAGDSVGISLENGRTVVWNPKTDSSSTYL